MPLAARVLLIPPGHLSTISKNAAKSCICHTSKNTFPQVFYLPHLRVPPSFSICNAFSPPSGFVRLPSFPGICRSRDGGFFFTSHESQITTDHQSLPSNFSAPAKAFIFPSFLAGKIPSVILGSVWENSHREQTAHLRRAIPEHRATRLGLYQRAAPGEVRPLFHGSFPVRGGSPGQSGGRGHHPGHRISAHSWPGDLAGHGHRLEESRAQPAPRRQETHRAGENLCAGQQFPQHASPDANLVLREVAHRAAIRGSSSRFAGNAAQRRRRLAHRRSRVAHLARD